MFEIAEELKDRDEVTLIVVEHETEETIDADRIVVLRDGKVVADRPAREVLRDVELLEDAKRHAARGGPLLPGAWGCGRRQTAPHAARRGSRSSGGEAGG